MRRESKNNKEGSKQKSFCLKWPKKKNKEEYRGRKDRKCEDNKKEEPSVFALKMSSKRGKRGYRLTNKAINQQLNLKKKRNI